MLYLTLKSIHVLAVMLFLGNIISGVFWKMHADRSGDLKVRAQVLAGILRSDRLFTLPAVGLIIVSGVLNALAAHMPILGTPWIAWGLGLFLLSGMVFSMRVGPLQKKLLASVEAGIAGHWDPHAYEALSRAWQFWGAVATGTPLIVVFLMVFKPTF
jgi:uncharacterized membrane protein